jgi:hypothetical protein
MDTGRREVYVQPYPATGQRYKLSSEGGAGPRWARSGREICYRRGDDLWVVPVESAATFRPGRPRLLFTAPFQREIFPNYDVAPDGERFLIVEREPDRPLRLVAGWIDEVRRALDT